MPSNTLYVTKRGSFSFVLGLVASALFRRFEALRLDKKTPPSALFIPNRKSGDGKPTKVRRLRASDASKGFYELLSQLTEVGKGDFGRRFREITNGCERVYVIESEDGSRIVASGTLVLERKFTRNCGTCGHIEDVVVDEGERGRDLGRVIVEALTRAAEACGCYKVILDCNESNVGFYERCGFKRKEVQMAKYFI
ncbi:Acyl-CoA N-acyltransferase [Ostreococcus tauri]|uniref:Glucosamine 6-phosphate N-acetyltransferase n=1 Tax=Ostreococcus tauri TaxID=70448 RepID=A0A090M7L3_OSTTA|nr:Acyl-CoA N-acyltransferase [Ostreococcus tauri]CEG01067.1 Acyl-CoA N-acyltransferase [Ostreococcus tauri]|eukprot:XP_003075123.2 Acyl-CoA N-acyltransferase [Ostreococcus tauri]